METNEPLVKAVLESAGLSESSEGSKRLTCSEAFKLAKEFKTEIIEIGNICNQHDIKICKCQLGCFK